MSSEQTSQAATNGDRVCGHPGCGKVIFSHNQSGYCYRHFGDSKSKKLQAKRAAGATGFLNWQQQGEAYKEKRQALKAAKANGHAKGNGVATISVSEVHLDNFWSKRSLEEKAELFTHFLHGGAQA